MKRGIELVEKSLEELLEEVFQNHFENFRKHLNDENIRTLILRNKVEGQNLRLLGEALKGSAVTQVKLPNNEIGPIGAKDFGEALTGTAVTQVSLTYNIIGPQGAKNLCETLKGTAVTQVNLSTNKIGPIGAKDIGEALKGTSVTQIKLTYNKIGPMGAKDFGETLKGTAITHVDLSDNKIGPIGAKDFGETLKKTAVTEVNLSDNEIGPIGAKDFVEALKATTVTQVNLSYNAIDDLCTEIISAIPETNLTEVILEGNKVSSAQQQQLEQALAANRLRLNLQAYATAQAILENNKDALNNPNSAHSFVPTEVIGLLLQHFPIVHAEGPSNRDKLINQFIDMANEEVLLKKSIYPSANL